MLDNQDSQQQIDINLDQNLMTRVTQFSAYAPPGMTWGPWVKIREHTCQCGFTIVYSPVTDTNVTAQVRYFARYERKK